MSSIDVGQYAYATYQDWPDYPYKIITYLMKNNELIWKLLKYNTPDAYNESNLSFEEKSAMIWKGYGEMVDFKVFNDAGQLDSFTKQGTIIRLRNYTLSASNRTVGNVSFMLEVFCYYNLDQLDNYRTRIDWIMQQFLETLNGKDIGIGLGKMFFNSSAAMLDRMEDGGQIPFKGKWLVMSNYTAS